MSQVIEATPNISKSKRRGWARHVFHPRGDRQQKRETSRHCSKIIRYGTKKMFKTYFLWCKNMNQQDINYIPGKR